MLFQLVENFQPLFDPTMDIHMVLNQYRQLNDFDDDSVFHIYICMISVFPIDHQIKNQKIQPMGKYLLDQWVWNIMKIRWVFRNISKFLKYFSAFNNFLCVKKIIFTLKCWTFRSVLFEALEQNTEFPKKYKNIINNFILSTI